MTATLLIWLLTTIVGQIYDAATLEPIGGVNVSIQGTSYGTASNEQGYFLLRAPISKSSTMVVSAIGYHVQRFKIEPEQSGGIDIGLKEKNTMLQDIFIGPSADPALAMMERVRAHRKEHAAALDKQRVTKKEVQLFVSDLPSRFIKRHHLDSTYLLPLQSILSEDSYRVLQEDFDDAPNFYHNTVYLYNTSFLSPLGAEGNRYYRYVWVDSCTIDFRSKNPFYPTFEGRMVIDTLTYGLRHLTAVVPPQSSVNYLRDLKVVQHFEPSYSDSVSLLLDWAIKADTTHVFPTLYVRRVAQAGSIDVGEQDTMPFVSEPDIPLFRAAKFIATTLQSGYIPTKWYVEVGNLAELLKINPVETVRIGLPVRTTEKLWKNVCLEAYAAYGFGTHAWSGSGQTALMRNLYYSGTKYAFLSHYRALSVETENDWTEHLETRFGLAAGRIADFDFSSVSGTFRLGWDDKKVDSYFRRRYVYNRLPIVYLNGEVGTFQTSAMSSYDFYGRLRAMVRQRVQLGVMGYLDYLLEGGMIFGKNLPLQLQTFAEGNDSYAFDSYRFTMMPTGRIATKEYLFAHATWNGRGCLFNLIPGIRYLRLRELAEVKVAYGSQDLSRPYVELGAGIGNILRIADLFATFRVCTPASEAFDTPWWAVRFRFHIEP